MGEEKAGGAARGTAPSAQRLVIDRKRWLRGEGADMSRLLRSGDGKMCCLGFLGVAIGLSVDDIRGRTSPAATHPGRWPRWLIAPPEATSESLENSDRCRVLMEDNDSRHMSDRTREANIAAVFAEHGIEVVFTDEEASTASAPKEPPEPTPIPRPSVDERVKEALEYCLYMFTRESLTGHLRDTFAGRIFAILDHAALSGAPLRESTDQGAPEARGPVGPPLATTIKQSYPCCYAPLRVEDGGGALPCPRHGKEAIATLTRESLPQDEDGT